MANLSSIKTNLTAEGCLLAAFQHLIALPPPNSESQITKRLFHGFAEDIPEELKSVTIDIYGNTLLVQRQSEGLPSQTFRDLLLGIFTQPETILYKSRYVSDGRFLHQTTLLRGFNAEEPFWVCENQLKFYVHLRTALDSGLYLDTAEVRLWLTNNANQKRILNLYSYTGSYGVAAMKGGALDVINVDSSNSAHQLAKKNYELNQLKINPRSFCQYDVKEFLRVAAKKNDSYDLIIIDPSPPSFALKTKEDKLKYYLNPLQKCLKILRPNGQILLSCHSFIAFTLEELKEAIQSINPMLTFSEEIPYPIHFAINSPKMLVIRCD